MLGDSFTEVSPPPTSPRDYNDKKGGDLRKRAFRKIHDQKSFAKDIKSFNQSVRFLENYKPFKVEDGANYWAPSYWFGIISHYSLDMEVFQTVLALLSAVFFIISTYIQLDIDGRLTSLLVLDLIFSFLFIFFFVINFFLAKDK